MLIGYCRVSTADQNLTLQKDELTKFGCSKIYDDTSLRARKLRASGWKPPSILPVRTARSSTGSSTGSGEACAI